jgi:hypothetical protein
MGWSRHDGVLVVVHAPGEPSEAEWGQFMDEARSAPTQGLLVIAPDASLSAKQRREVQHWFSEGGTRGAVVTDSKLTRGVVTAISWFKIPIKAFSPRDLEKALDFLGVAPDASQEVQRIAHDLQQLMWRSSERLAR